MINIKDKFVFATDGCIYYNSTNNRIHPKKDQTPDKNDHITLLKYKKYKGKEYIIFTTKKNTLGRIDINDPENPKLIANTKMIGSKSTF